MSIIAIIANAHAGGPNQRVALLKEASDWPKLTNERQAAIVSVVTDEKEPLELRTALVRTICSQANLHDKMAPLVRDCLSQLMQHGPDAWGTRGGDAAHMLFAYLDAATGNTKCANDARVWKVVAEGMQFVHEPLRGTILSRCEGIEPELRQLVAVAHFARVGCTNEYVEPRWWPLIDGQVLDRVWQFAASAEEVPWCALGLLADAGDARAEQLLVRLTPAASSADARRLRALDWRLDSSKSLESLLRAISNPGDYGDENWALRAARRAGATPRELRKAVAEFGEKASRLDMPQRSVWKVRHDCLVLLLDDR
jgi:hypothetical protein